MFGFLFQVTKSIMFPPPSRKNFSFSWTSYFSFCAANLAFRCFNTLNLMLCPPRLLAVEPPADVEQIGCLFSFTDEGEASVVEVEMAACAVVTTGGRREVGEWRNCDGEEQVKSSELCSVEPTDKGVGYGGGGAVRAATGLPKTSEGPTP